MFHARLKQAVKDSGLAVKEIASLANVNKRTIENWLGSDPTMPRADDAVAVALTLGSTVEYLVTGEAPKALGKADEELLALARRFKTVLLDLEAMPEGTREAMVLAIHANAEQARATRANSAAG